MQNLCAVFSKVTFSFSVFSCDSGGHRRCVLVHFPRGSEGDSPRTESSAGRKHPQKLYQQCLHLETMVPRAPILRGKQLKCISVKNLSIDFLSAVLFYRPSLIWVRTRIESATNENATLLSTTECIGSHWIFSFFSKNFPFYKVNTKLRRSSKFFQLMNITYVLYSKLVLFFGLSSFLGRRFWRPFLWALCLNPTITSVVSVSDRSFVHVDETYLQLHTSLLPSIYHRNTSVGQG